MVDAIEKISQWKTRIAVGRMAFDAGFYAQAARHFRSALELLKENEDAEQLRSINFVCLAKALSCLGEYSEAEKLINEALQTDSISSSNVLELARDYLELASLCKKQNRTQQCETYARKVLELLTSLNKEERVRHAPSIAHAYRLLAVIKDEQNQYDEGLRLIDLALNVLENAPLGAKSDAYGEALMVKVMLLIDKGEVEQVDEMLENAVELVELHKGLLHPQLAKVIGILIDHAKRSGHETIGQKVFEQFHKQNVKE